MKKLVSITTAVLLIILAGTISAQSVRFGPSIGFTFPKNQDINLNEVVDRTLELDGDVHYGAKLKIGFPVLPLTITGGFLYTKLSGSIPAFDNSSVEQTIYVISVGGEYAFIPGPIQPYGALDLMFTSLGELKMPQSTDDSSTSRVGLGIGAGIDIKILPKIDVDLSLKYCFNNMFGKEDGEDSFNTTNVTVNFLFNVL